MDIAEHLASLKKSRGDAADRMNEVAQKAMDEQRSMNDGEKEEFDTIKVELGTLDADIKRYSELLDMQAAKAEPVQPRADDAAGNPVQPPTYRVAKNTQKLEKGIEFARYAMCLGSARGELTTAKAIAESRFPEMERLHSVFKSAVESGSTTSGNWASDLTEHREIVTDFVEFLRPKTILGQFGQNGVPSLRPIPFNVHIKAQTAGSTAGWVGEGTHKPVSAGTYNDVYMGWAKLAAISVATDELLRFSNPSAERLIRDDLADAVIAQMDTSFIQIANTGTTNVKPASITYKFDGSATAVPAGTSDPESDIAGLWSIADTGNLDGTSGVYITTPAVARKLSGLVNTVDNRRFPNITPFGGSYQGVPLIVSNHVDTDAFILAIASEIWLADDGVVTLDASREASIIMDTAPETAVDAANPSGTPPVLRPQSVSMYQTNSVAFRAERYINWKTRRDDVVNAVKGSSWA